MATQDLSVGEDLLAGSFAGVSILLVGHPFDLLKVRMQTAEAGRFRSGFHVLASTIRHEGAIALYKGMGAPMATVPLLNAVVFASFAQGRSFLVGSDDIAMTPGQAALAGAWAGLVNSSLACPIELVKNRLQIQYEGARTYAGPWDCVRQVIAKDGTRGIFQGMFATISREVPCYAAQFYTYETVKEALRRPEQSIEDLDASQQILAGGLAGVACWAASYPQDFVKSTLQVRARGTFPVHAWIPDGGFISAWRHTVRQYGWMGLWKGFGPCVARAFPANAAGFVTYEFVCRRLRERHAVI